MPRSNRPRRKGKPVSKGADGEKGGFYSPTTWHENHTDGEWIVHAVSGAAAQKAYRCPGCDQVIPPQTAHVVAWRAEHFMGDELAGENRRHWHSSCWKARNHRGPTAFGRFK